MRASSTEHKTNKTHTPPTPIFNLTENGASHIEQHPPKTNNLYPLNAPPSRGVTEKQQEALDRAVEALEGDGGASGAASSPLVDGSWRLIFTTTPGTASPVQRSFVGVDGFAIYQDIDLFSCLLYTSPSPRD